MKYNCQTKNFLIQLEIKRGRFYDGKRKKRPFLPEDTLRWGLGDGLFPGVRGRAVAARAPLRARGLFPGRRLAVGKVCPQSVELSLEAAGPAAVEAGGLLRVPMEVWSRTSMEPGRSWLALFPLSSSLFLMDRGIL